jgi:two-component system NarL family sensor kinase
MPRKPFPFDADAILSNGLLYLILAGYVATVYTAVLSLLLVTGLVSSADPRVVFNPPAWVNVVVISVVAFTLWPVRRWLQSRINVLIYGQHDDAYALISEINQQLQAMAALQLTLPIVAETVVRVLKLPFAAISTQDLAAPLHVESGKLPVSAELTRLPVTYLDKPLGELCVAARRSNESLSASDLALLRDVARQVGIAIHAAQLTADLQASRERIVAAREEERRRIRNDLHDGLAPTLSALQLQLGALRNVMRTDPERAEATLDELRTDLRGATADIRRLVYDLRPPMLDELGLVGAIKSFKFEGSGVSFALSAPDAMPLLSAAVEVAVYRIASEAIHNVVRHSQATSCDICIETTEGRLSLRVSDNGSSPPAAYQPGVGLRSMQERAAEVGGSVSIGPGAHGGTAVDAQFPINP